MSVYHVLVFRSVSSHGTHTSTSELSRPSIFCLLCGIIANKTRIDNHCNRRTSGSWLRGTLKLMSPLAQLKSSAFSKDRSLSYNLLLRRIISVRVRIETTALGIVNCPGMEGLTPVGGRVIGHGGDRPTLLQYQFRVQWKAANNERSRGSKTSALFAKILSASCSHTCLQVVVLSSKHLLLVRITASECRHQRKHRMFLAPLVAAQQ